MMIHERKLQLLALVLFASLALAVSSCATSGTETTTQGSGTTNGMSGMGTAGTAATPVTATGATAIPDSFGRPDTIPTPPDTLKPR